MKQRPMVRFLFILILCLVPHIALLPHIAQARLPRIVSLNMCADPYLMAFATRAQIRALTHLSHNPELSAFSAQAAHFPASTGRVEDILRRAPDIVITSPYSDPMKQALLTARGIRIFVLDGAHNYTQARDEILKLGTAIHRRPQAEAYLAQLDAHLDRLANHQTSMRVLNLQRRGITVGAGHILDDIIHYAGARNAAPHATPLGRLRLERVFTLNPDILLLSAAQETQAGRGLEFLIHPALAKKFPPHRRIYLPEKYTLCAGATTPLAVAALQRALMRARK